MHHIPKSPKAQIPMVRCSLVLDPSRMMITARSPLNGTRTFIFLNLQTLDSYVAIIELICRLSVSLV